MVGKQELIAECVRHAPVDECSANELTLAALIATLNIYQTEERVVHQIPLWQLLTTPLENLEQRANRLAMLISSAPNIASAEARECSSRWCDSPELQLDGRSWGIVIHPADNSLGVLIKQLHEANPRIIFRQEQNEQHEGQLWLDLRGVFPRWDQHLVAAFER